MDRDVGTVGGVVVKGLELRGLLAKLEGTLQRPGMTCPGDARDVLDGAIDFVRQAGEALAGAIGLVDGLLAQLQDAGAGTGECQAECLTYKRNGQVEIEGQG